jgi:hypothetical protein
VRIVLLTGSLEPGRDGVGDYTRHLAVEATHRGESCRLVALADRQVAAPQTTTDDGIETLRLPSLLPWRRRVEAARAFLRESPPDWVSLQFVPYSFQRWGLASALVRSVPELIGDARLHLMFHEIWIDGRGSWRRRAVSALQRRLAVSLGRTPGAVSHTSNSTYTTALRAHGVPAETMQLFGSVPVGQDRANGWLASPLAAAGCSAFTDRSRWWLIALFGTLHPVWPPEPLMSELQAAAANAGKRLAIISAGRIGAGESLWQQMVSTYGRTTPMIKLDSQPPARLSQLFNTVDFGVATTPLALIGKSATAASMFEHGLPVIVNREDGAWTSAEVSDARERALIIRLGPDFAARLDAARRLPPAWRLPEVTAQWLGALGRCSIRSPAW